MKHDDSECKQDYQEKKNEEYTGQNNIGEDPFHDVIQERINHIVIQLLSDLLFADILDDPLDETIRNMNISPGLRFRHFYDTIFKRYIKVKRGCPFTLAYPCMMVIRNATC
jgi:hypothetical protein